MFTTTLPNGTPIFSEKDGAPAQHVTAWQERAGKWHVDTWTSDLSYARERTRAIRRVHGADCIVALILSDVSEIARPAKLVKHGSHYRTYLRA